MRSYLKLVISFCSLPFLLPTTAFSQSKDVIEPLEEITVKGSANSYSSGTSLVVTGTELQNKGSYTLGDALSDNLGLSTSSFGQSANRPIIRGLSGNRVQILENGLVSGDLSALSADHAIAGEPLFMDRVEVLRGSDSLRYGSGSFAGLINVLNNRIPEVSLASPVVELRSQYNFNNQGFTNGALVEDSIGNWALHSDITHRAANNYQRPDGQRQDYSFSSQDDFGFGASYQRTQGYTGFSIGQNSNFYGIPSRKGSQIDLKQQQVELVDVERMPFNGVEKIESKFSYIHYEHTELSTDSIPQTGFTNKTYQGRVEIFNDPIFGWKGSFGVQGSQGDLSAIDLTNPLIAAAVIPPSRSNKLAGFISQSRSIGTIDLQAGTRYEMVSYNPDSSIAYTDNAPNSFEPTQVNKTQFNLFSLTGSAFWNYAPSYALGLTYGITQKAPSVDELYSFGNHDATASFDIGNSSLSKETSYQLELGWRKTKGLIQGKANLYQAHVRNYIYAFYPTGAVSDLGYAVRQYQQADATIQGAEGEISYNLYGDGFSGRVFSDTTQGAFDGGGNLPLQPATRFGGNLGYKWASWKGSMNFIHALNQNTLAVSETPTAGYNKLDIRLDKSLFVGNFHAGAYVMVSNLLNDTIRYSTTVEDLRVNAPLPGRAIIVGLKVDY